MENMDCLKNALCNNYEYDCDDYDGSDAYAGDYDETSYDDWDFEKPSITDVDKIINIIYEMIKSINLLTCNIETGHKIKSFIIDSTIGKYEDWIETAKLFNFTNDNSNYKIVINENIIICKCNCKPYKLY